MNFRLLLGRYFPFLSFVYGPVFLFLDVAGRPKCFHQDSHHHHHFTTLAQIYEPLPRRLNRTFNFLTSSLLHGWPIPLYLCCLSSSGCNFPQTKHNHRSPMQRMISSQLVRPLNTLQLLLPVCHAIWLSPPINSLQTQSMER